jgi:hypothetical protein
MSDEREAARAKLRQSVDRLTEQVSLQAKLQRSPLQLLGALSGIGLTLGFLLGRRGRSAAVRRAAARAASKVGKAAAGFELRGLVLGALGPLLWRIAQDKLIAPFLEQGADRLIERAKKRRSEPPQDRDS